MDATPSPARPAFGLCDTCRHQRIVPTTRGSTFSRCGLAEREPRLARYPRVPVLECRWHEPRDTENAASGPQATMPG